MSNVARQDLHFGRQFTLEEILGGIDAVSVERIHAMSGELFCDSRVALAAVGRLTPFRLTEKALRL